MLCHIALGSNLGDRLAHFRRALQLMLERIPGAALKAAAPVYETAPVDCPEGSGAFYNSVVALKCAAGPLEVLRELRRIEEDLGRPNAHGHHAPRTIDLDLLCVDDRVMAEPELVLPHPRLGERRFVLQPLADISPDLVPPGLGRSVARALADLPEADDAVRLVERHWA